MKLEFFTEQMKRLENTFGAKCYSHERVRLIWDRVNDLSDQWMKSAVNQFLANSKFAPLPADFFELVQVEKNKNYTTEPQGKEVESIFSPDEIKEILSVIKGIGTGKVSKIDAEMYAKNLDRILKERGVAR